MLSVFYRYFDIELLSLLSVTSITSIHSLYFFRGHKSLSPSLVTRYRPELKREDEFDRF